MEKINNEETEQLLLNCLLLDNNIMDSLEGNFNKEFFFNSRNKHIYEKMREQWNSTQHFDVVTLTHENPEIDAKYVMTLTTLTPSAVGWRSYATELKQLYRTRFFKNKLKSVYENTNQNNIDQSITDFEADLSNISFESDDGHTMKNLAISAIEYMQQAMNREEVYTGFESGFEGLDSVLDGFQKDNMYVIGARPSIGKTAFALAILMGIASKGVKTAVFSLEMSAISLYFRMLSAKSNIPMWQIKKGVIQRTSSTMGRLQRANEELFKQPVSIRDSGIDNDKVLYSKIRYEVRVNHAEVIVIDHLGLIEVSDSSGQRYVDVGRITKTLHKMARELHVCIIVLAQCGREAEGKKPNLSLLRESGNIEQDADVIMLLHRERELDDVKEKDKPDAEYPTDVIVAKNRDGQTGTVTFGFKPICMKFFEDPNRSAMKEGEATKSSAQKEVDYEIPY